MNRSRNAAKIVEVCERREEIRVGRPLAWAVQLGLLALVVTALRFLIGGADLDTVLVRSSAALLIFGAAGFAAGRLIERPPRLDPELLKTPEEVQTVPNRARRIGLDAVRPGMILAEPARKADGEILIPSDTALTEELLEVMREYEIPSAVVKYAEGGEKHHDEEGSEATA